MINRYVGSISEDEALFNLLEKLDIKSAENYMLFKFFKHVSASYGTPDQILMSQSDYVSLHKAFTTPGSDDQ